MRKLGVGFAGSDVHIGGYVESFLVNEKAVLIGACDKSQESAKNISDQGSMEYFTTDYQRLIEDESVDIIVVCSPDHSHAEHADCAQCDGRVASSLEAYWLELLTFKTIAEPVAAPIQTASRIR